MPACQRIETYPYCRFFINGKLGMKYFARLKDRNRGMILLLIEKIKNTNNPEFIPLLKAWQMIDYKKVQTELQKAIDMLENKNSL